MVPNKTSIFLHHTAGLTADGAISWWNQTPEKVGTAYVIDRDGTIYECFDPKAWGYHLGIKGDDDYQEKYSIGIEIVAGGQLYLEGNKFMFYPLYPNKAAGKEIPKTDVVDMGEQGWKGYRYYHCYTDKQTESIIWLVNKLAEDFKIKIQSDLKSISEYNPEILSKHLPGLWAHSSVRKDKVDVVPYKTFMDKLINGIKTVSVTPTEQKGFKIGTSNVSNKKK